MYQSPWILQDLIRDRQAAVARAAVVRTGRSAGADAPCPAAMVGVDPPGRLVHAGAPPSSLAAAFGSLPSLNGDARSVGGSDGPGGATSPV